MFNIELGLRQTIFYTKKSMSTLHGEASALLASYRPQLFAFALIFLEFTIEAHCNTPSCAVASEVIIP